MRKQARALMIAAVIAAIALGMAVFVAAEETTASAEAATTIVYAEQNALTDVEKRVASMEDDVKTAKIYATVIVAVAIFLGLSTWVGLQKMIEAQLNGILKKKIGKKNNMLNSLKSSARREQQAKRLKVLFAAGEEGDALAGSEYDELRKFFSDQGYLVSDKTVWLKADDVKKKVNAHDIVVFYVSKAEASVPAKETKKADTPVQEPFYSVLVKHCGEKHQCLLYTPGFLIDREIQKKTYVTTVNFHSKLRETLYMLLYFSPLNKE